VSTSGESEITRESLNNMSVRPSKLATDNMKAQPSQVSK
jgi:hypothetical protein